VTILIQLVISVGCLITLARVVSPREVQEASLVPGSGLVLVHQWSVGECHVRECNTRTGGWRGPAW